MESDYLYRDAQLLAAETRYGRRHYHLDHLGTPRLITNGVGYPVAYHVYYPFGEEATAFNQDRERMKFTGHERDFGSLAGAGDDLDYMHARFYNPQVGRLLSVDPVFSAKPTQPQSWNRYAYALNNPLRFIDPTGETVESALGLVNQYAEVIAFASYLTGGTVSTMEIARVLFQENRNDFNWVRGDDSSALAAGGPEFKNAAIRFAFLLGLTHGSYGIGEMRTNTAAQLLGWEPKNLTVQQRQAIDKLLSNPVSAILLTTLYLAELRKQSPSATSEELASAYNTGSFSGPVSEVAMRSGPYVQDIGNALTTETRVVRCNGSYKFEHQCQ